MSDSPKPRTFREYLEQRGISAYKQEPREYFDLSEELEKKQAAAKKVSLRRPRISLDQLHGIAVQAGLPKLHSIKNKQILQDVIELRGWMAKGPDFCNYENALKTWGRIMQTLSEAIMDGNEQTFSDFAKAWEEWKPAEAFVKRDEEEYRDRESDSIGVRIYRAMPCPPQSRTKWKPNVIKMIGYISSIQNDLGWAPTITEICEFTTQKDPKANGMDQGEVSRLTSDMGLTHLLSKE